jgi:hypothetical protein
MHQHPQPEKIELTSDELEKIESEFITRRSGSKTKKWLLKSYHSSDYD